MKATLTIGATSRRLRIAALIIASAALANTAAARSDDAAYCAQLASMVQRYISSTPAGAIVMPNAVTVWAIEQCRWGDPAAAIPILEKKLLDHRFSLPKR